MNRLEILIERELYGLPCTPQGAFIHAAMIVFDLNESDIKDLRGIIIEGKMSDPSVDDQYVQWLAKVVSLLGERVKKGPAPAENEVEAMLMQVIGQTVPPEVMRRYFSRDQVKALAGQVKHFWNHIITRVPNWQEKIARNVAAIAHMDVMGTRSETSPLPY